ncbi:MAG: hypothetical protein QY307_05265 [Acidimicrobiia bacterium]|nr:MAG: hypothetical protein QY307_05265 [Acidimicrobiia bacterium]
MRDELLSIEAFDTLLEAQVLIADWREEYNGHSAFRRGVMVARRFQLGLSAKSRARIR